MKSEEANNPYYYYTAVRQGLEVTEAVGLRARPTAPLPGTRQRKPWRELLTVAGMGGGGQGQVVALVKDVCCRIYNYFFIQQLSAVDSW